MAKNQPKKADGHFLSIEAHLVELREFAAKEKLEIVASLCEAQTAKEPEKMSARTLFWPEAGFS